MSPSYHRSYLNSTDNKLPIPQRTPRFFRRNNNDRVTPSPQHAPIHFKDSRVGLPLHRPLHTYTIISSISSRRQPIQNGFRYSPFADPTGFPSLNATLFGRDSTPQFSPLHSNGGLQVRLRKVRPGEKLWVKEIEIPKTKKKMEVCAAGAAKTPSSRSEYGKASRTAAVFKELEANVLPIRPVIASSPLPSQSDSSIYRIKSDLKHFPKPDSLEVNPFISRPRLSGGDCTIEVTELLSNDWNDSPIAPIRFARRHLPSVQHSSSSSSEQFCFGEFSTPEPSPSARLMARKLYGKNRKKNLVIPQDLTKESSTNSPISGNAFSTPNK